jgi:peptide/nickel transport system permease protein/oligopeptide transport system permease protein
MARFILRRLVALVPVALGASFAAFFLIHLIPGDPAEVIAGIGASGADIERVRGQLGLDRPVLVQYALWLERALVGDLGMSLVSRQPVLGQVLSRFGNTLQLSLAGMAVALGLGLATGIAAAVRRGTLWDYVFSLLAIFGVSVPIFWLGLLLMLLFALELGWLPATGMDGAAAFVLPALTLGLNAAALIARITRSSVLDVLGQDFVRTAHAKGASPRRVLWVHVLRNGAIPILTVSALQFGYLLGGAVLTETVFVWPGLGRLLTDAILQRDFPVIQGGILVVALSMILLNLVTDLLYAVADPRIRYD